MLVLLTVLACSRPAPDIVTRWEADPIGTKASLILEEDRLARSVSVFTVLAAHPEDAQKLCYLLERQADQDWCEDIAGRPHLWSEAPRVPLPVWSEPIPQSRLARIEPQAPDPCGSPSDVCAEHQAMEAALAGDTQKVAALCAGISQPRWQQECAFLSAETLARSGRPYADVADTCLLAGPFTGSCFAHVVPTLIGVQPGLKRRVRVRWRGILRADAEIDAYWSAHTPALSPRFRGLFWEQIGELWLEGFLTLSPLAWDQLPPVAIPHLRAACAVLVIQREPGDLDAAESTLARWESDRFAAATPRRARLVMSRRPADDDAAPAPLAWIPYLNGERRLSSTDPAEDRRLALLEAAARLGADAILQQGARDENPLIRSGAERLLR